MDEVGPPASLSSSPRRRPARAITYEDVLRVVSGAVQCSAVQCSAVQCSPPQVGDAHRWQLKIVLLLRIPMFMCGTQFITTDFMTYEPKVLFCEPKGCKNIDPTKIFTNNGRSPKEDHNDMENFNQYNLYCPAGNIGLYCPPGNIGYIARRAI